MFAGRAFSLVEVELQEAWITHAIRRADAQGAIGIGHDECLWVLTSLFVDALAPLAATETARYLNIRRPPKFDPEELPLGRIMVFSLPAAPTAFRALMPNFGSHYFFRSTESHAGALATAIMGTREVQPKDWEERGALVIDGSTPPRSELICPAGALARLEPCQAYVSIAGSDRRPGLLWLGANHESAPLRPAPPETSSPDDALRSLRTTVFPPVVPEPAAVPPSSEVRYPNWRRPHSGESFA